MRKFLILALLITLGILTSAGCGSVRGSDVSLLPEPLVPMPAPTTTPSPEPLVPTPVGGTEGMESGQDTSAKTSPLASLPVTPPQEHDGFGVGVPAGAAGPITDYAVKQLGIGWYLNWWVEVDPYRPDGVAFWQMIRVSEEGYRPGPMAICAAAEANPGSVWLIGNEPDVLWQDSTTPERYAELYHELYHLLKSADPTCRVAIGGVAQPTPLRLLYLDRVLLAYQTRHGEPMPVDIWNVHNFVLREERDSWGVGIPPGMDASVGVLYEIKDHDDLEAFKSQVLNFRRWMAERGQRDRPLVISEYGILMPPDYGFDEARVQAFMYATFDFFLTATDEKVGYPQDDNRLVQWWAWYSLADTVYPTGNLFDPETKNVTPLGAAFARYMPPEGSDGR